MTKIQYQMDPWLGIQGKTLTGLATFPPHLFIKSKEQINNSLKMKIKSQKGKRTKFSAYCSYLWGSHRHKFLSTETMRFQEYLINYKIMLCFYICLGTKKNIIDNDTGKVVV